MFNVWVGTASISLYHKKKQNRKAITQRDTEDKDIALLLRRIMDRCIHRTRRVMAALFRARKMEIA